jgi:hypothetical protein
MIAMAVRTAKTEGSIVRYDMVKIGGASEENQQPLRSSLASALLRVCLLGLVIAAMVCWMLARKFLARASRPKSSLEGLRTSRLCRSQLLGRGLSVTDIAIYSSPLIAVLLLMEQRYPRNRKPSNNLQFCIL